MVAAATKPPGTKIRCNSVGMFVWVFVSMVFSFGIVIWGSPHGQLGGKEGPVVPQQLWAGHLSNGAEAFSSACSAPFQVMKGSEMHTKGILGLFRDILVAKVCTAFWSGCLRRLWHDRWLAVSVLRPSTAVHRGARRFVLSSSRGLLPTHKQHGHHQATYCTTLHRANWTMKYTALNPLGHRLTMPLSPASFISQLSDQIHHPAEKSYLSKVLTSKLWWSQLTCLLDCNKIIFPSICMHKRHLACCICQLK
jgi:hypothetical protein